jgi:heme-degrading monooxygenase HmoA
MPVAVIFISHLNPGVEQEYGPMADRMVELAHAQPGFLRIESVRDETGFGMTISYWQDRQAISDWQRHPEHLEAQRLGREKWYAWYRIEICDVAHERFFEA